VGFAVARRVADVASVASATAVQRFLSEVEDVPLADVGALVVERNGGREGVVLVEEGRVCWAAAARMPRRLSDLLLERAPGLEAKDLQQVFERCRVQGRPLGESLVSDGLLSPDGLRRALLEHTADALSLLAGCAGARTRWFSRDERSYDPRFTFSTVELATALATRELPDLASEASATLVATLTEGSCGVALYRGGGASRPVSIAQHGPRELSLAAIEILSEWAVRSLDLSSAFTEGARFTVSTLDTGESWIGWREGDLVYLGVCFTPRQTAGLIGALRRR
jgi:hypothetical protein